MFNLAQVFYVAADSVKNSAKIGISKVDLFFAAKPKITGNKSGIYAPGVEVFLSEVSNGIPSVFPIKASALEQPIKSRREYSEISTSNDGTVPVTFQFPTPVQIKTDMFYAIIIKFDGNEDFLLWEARAGDFLINTETVCDGPSGTYIGNLYGYVGPSMIYPDSVATGFSGENWKPYNNQDLKFSVYCARYFTEGVPNANSTNTSDFVTTNGSSISITAPVYPTELIAFDKKISSYSNLVFGDWIYQTQSYFPGGYATPATLSGNTTSDVLKLNTFQYANSGFASWADLFTLSSEEQNYIIVKSLNHNGAGQHLTAVRRVADYHDEYLRIDEPLPFVNTAARFYKAPIGRLASASRSYVYGTYTDIITITDSNANSSCRFVNDAVISSTINAGGTGYSNTDYIVVTGFENVVNEVQGGYQAVANLVTNSTGGITNTFISNAGCGFVNGYAYSIKASSGANSAGSSANLAFAFGATLMTGQGNETTYFKGAKVINMEAAQITPSILIDFPAGSQYTIKFNTLYYGIKSANTFSGKAYFVDAVAMSTPIDLKNEYTETFTANTPVVVSRSNQYSVRFANGYVANSSVVGSRFSNVASYTITTTSNNDFAMISIKPKNIDSYYAKYTINNDYTNEHTNYGNAYAKHITTKVNFEEDYRAEDLIVYLTAFRPANTDIKVYARIHNSNDSDSFDDKDWSLMEQVGGIGVYSNPTNSKDMIEYTYNFPAYPNTEFIFPGTVTTSNNSGVIVGVGTTFNANLAVNDLVKVYSPLFANSNYIIGAVSSITNSTYMTLSTPITNASMLGSGFKVDKLKYSHQAFNNITNDNVVRYYNTSAVEHDTFDTFQLKIVMLSDNDSIVPRIDDCKGIGVSA